MIRYALLILIAFGAMQTPGLAKAYAQSQCLDLYTTQFSELISELQTYGNKYLPERLVEQAVASAKDLNELSVIAKMVNENSYSHGYELFPIAYVKRLREMEFTETQILEQSVPLNTGIQTNILSNLALERKTLPALKEFIFGVKNTELFPAETITELYRQSLVRMIAFKPSFEETMNLYVQVAQNDSARINLLETAASLAKTTGEFEIVTGRLSSIMKSKLKVYEVEDLRSAYLLTQNQIEQKQISSPRISADLAELQKQFGGVSGYLRHIFNQFEM